MGPWYKAGLYTLPTAKLSDIAWCHPSYVTDPVRDEKRIYLCFCIYVSPLVFPLTVVNY